MVGDSAAIRFSAVVGSTARQDANNDDCSRLELELKPHAPIPDSQSPFVTPSQAPEVERRVLVEQTIERGRHPPRDLRVESSEVSLGAPLEAERPPRLLHHYSRVRLTSSNGIVGTPAARSASTSAIAASSSAVTGSSSTGAASR